MLEGRQEGREEGLAEGLRRAHVTLLIRQLEAKFGPLSADSQERIRNATNEQREVYYLPWEERGGVVGRFECRL